MTNSRPIRAILWRSAFTFILLTTTHHARAAQLLQVKGANALIEFTSEETLPSEGNQFYGLVGGEKKAVIEITKVKGHRAIGRVISGTLDVDATLSPAPTNQPPPPPSTPTATKPASREKKRPAPPSVAKGKKSRYHREATPFEQMTFGALVGYALDTQTVTVSGQSLTMTGAGMSLSAFVDNPISGPLGLISRGGAEQFSVKGSKSGANVKTDLLYFTLDLLLRYDFMEGVFVPQAYGGISIHVPVGKSSDVLDTNQISTTTVFPIGIGAKYALSGTWYLTGSAEYVYFMPSSQVTTSAIAVRAGGGLSF